MLLARHAGHIEGSAVCTPERDAKILVLFFVEIGPGEVALEVREANPDVRVLFTHLGVVRFAKLTILAEGRIDGEHGHLGVVKVVEGQFLAVRAPPEGAILGRSAQDFLIIDPAGIAIHHGFGAVGGELGFFAAGDVHHPQVVLAREGELGGIRAVGEVHCPLRLEGKVRELFRRVHACGLGEFFADGDDIAVLVRVRAVLREGYLLVIEPFVRAREVLRLDSEGAEGQRHDEDLCFHDPKGSEKNWLKHRTRALR